MRGESSWLVEPQNGNSALPSGITGVDTSYSGVGGEAVERSPVNFFMLKSISSVTVGTLDNHRDAMAVGGGS